jgi:hypothetical protein
MLCESFSVNQTVIDFAFKWLLEKEGGFELCLHSLSNHSIVDIAEDIVTLISHFITTAPNPEDRLVSLYKDRFHKYYTSPMIYLAAITEILPYLIRKHREELIKSKLIDYWIDMAIRQADSSGTLTVEERIPAVTFLAEIWYSFTGYIDSKGTEISNQFLTILRKMSRERSHAAKTVAVSLMFRLLDQFAQDKNMSAPTLYKSLIFTMIESFNDKLIREHYINNFSYLFQTVPSIPIGLLVDPLLKQLMNFASLTTFDFDFLRVLTMHPKFNQQMAQTLLDLMAKLFFSDPISSGPA